MSFEFLFTSFTKNRSLVVVVSFLQHVQLGRKNEESHIEFRVSSTY